MNPNLNPDQFREFMSLGQMIDKAVTGKFGGGHSEPDEYPYLHGNTEPASVEWSAHEAHKRGADGVN